MWGPGNYDLFLLPSARYAQEVVSDIYVVQFAKSGLATLINSVCILCRLSRAVSYVIEGEREKHDACQ